MRKDPRIGGMRPTIAGGRVEQSATAGASLMARIRRHIGELVDRLGGPDWNRQ